MRAGIPHEGETSAKQPVGSFDRVRLYGVLAVAHRLHDHLRAKPPNTKELAMQTRKVIFAALAGSLLVFGCNRAESPGEVQEDVADAQQDAAEQSSEAREEVATSETPGQVMENEYDLAITEAEGQHQVAMEACEAMSGTEQEACKARADEELAAAKQRAESLKPQ
jgi:hypothetical protein